MNRVIKFRQFAMGKMFYWGFGIGGDESHFSGPISGSGVLPHKSPQMQFTGLHDVNGVEIYESDVCRLSYAPRATCIGKICFEEGMFIFETRQAKPNKGSVYHSTIEPGNTIEVIGNIYEHPHLLDEAK